jgi:hypothetical protein
MSREARSGNLANPMIGCRVQQTCKVQPEQAVEVGRNDKDGTSSKRGSFEPKAALSHTSGCQSPQGTRGPPRATVDRSGAAGRGRIEQMSMEGHFDNPKRGVQSSRLQTRMRPSGLDLVSKRRAGPRESERVFEGEVKVTRAGPNGRPDPQEARFEGKPHAGPLRISPIRRAAKVGEWRRPTIRNPEKRRQHRAVALLQWRRRQWP